ncbi:hypothetical protein ACN28I_32775 [Archangium gephyra]|uniref:hypothetical protein n=1 Tax=Archangium gephyra TaxID=48 RepID=UPI003B79849B
MSQVLVEILADGTIRYSPSNKIHANYTVTFQVDGIPANVTVDFDIPCCFTSSAPLTLNSSTQATAPETVSSSVTPGSKYGFTATIPDKERKKFPNWEAKRGELEVPVDPPEEDRQRR